MKTILETDTQFICDIQSPCFQALTGEEVEWVRGSKTQVLFRKGDSLTKQGAFASYVLFVIKGIAKQYIEGDSNRSYNIRIIQQGEFVGIDSVFSKNVFNFSVVALNECQVYLIERDVIRSLIKNNGMFSINLITKYCEQNNFLYNSLHSLNFNQMTGRLSGTLIYIDNIKQESPEIFQLLSRKDLADFAGISVESTVKLLKGFERDKLITLNEKDIVVLERSKLEQIAKNG